MGLGLESYLANKWKQWVGQCEGNSMAVISLSLAGRSHMVAHHTHTNKKYIFLFYMIFFCGGIWSLVWGYGQDIRSGRQGWPHSPATATEQRQEQDQCNVYAQWGKGWKGHSSSVSGWIPAEETILFLVLDKENKRSEWYDLERSNHNKWTWDLSKARSPTLQSTFVFAKPFQEDTKQVKICSREATSMCLSSSIIPKQYYRWAFHIDVTNHSPPSCCFYAQISPFTYRKALGPKDFCTVIHEIHQQHVCFGYLSVLEIRKRWNPEGPMCCVRPGGQDWHWSVTEVRLWPLEIHS